MRGKRNRKAPEETPKRNKPKKPKAKPFFTYTVDQMVEAVDAVKGGRLKINAAAKAFKVPRSTLENKVKGTSPMIRKMGPSSILTAEEEGILVAWIIQCSRAGFPISKLELIDSAQRLIKELKRDNPFTDGRPGRKWYDAFLAAVMNKAAVKSNSPKVPTPFKKALFWPALRADDKKKRRKTEKIPSVISSAAWQTYYARSAEKKKQAEELQAKKKREREEIKEKKKAAAEQLREKRRKAAEERKQKPKPSKRAKKDISPEKEDVNSDCSDAVDTPSSPSSKHDDGVDRDQIQMNSYVIVNYEGELFPGQVIAKKSNGATVKVMTMAGNGWKWPDKDDILFYNFCDIEAIIEPPTLQNSRGVCSVPEILKCKKKLHF